MQSENTSTTARAPRRSGIFVIILMLLPLVLIGIAKYLPSLSKLPKISAISIVPPRVVGSPENNYMVDDVPKRLRLALGDLPGTRIERSPTPAEEAVAQDDLAKLAGMVGADVLVLTSITIDAGIVQLSVQLYDPKTNRVLYNNPFQSSTDRYPDMVQAAGAALKRTLTSN